MRITPQMGLEPTAVGVEIRRSIHLSYWGNGSRNGVRTRECKNTVDLKSTPLDQLGHPTTLVQFQSFK